MKKKWTLTLLAALTLGFSLPSRYLAQSRSHSTIASRTVQKPQLGSVEQFKEAFQNDAGKVRLVALLSPT